MSKQILILDSSQLSTYLECPEKHSLVNIEHLTKSNTLDDPMVAGTLMHKYLEIYYWARGKGQSVDVATRLALAFDPDEKDETDSHQYPLGKELRQSIVNRFQARCWRRHISFKQANCEQQCTITQIALCFIKSFLFGILNTLNYRLFFRK